MKQVYVYLLDTLADWELGYVLSGLNSDQFFKADHPKLSMKTVSLSKYPIKTLGGITILPDGLIDKIIIEKDTILLLPGAYTWDDPKHLPIIEKAKQLLAVGGTVAAICGATGALANAGLLDNRPHTSNAVEYLEMVCPTYKGQSHFKSERAYMDQNLITASAAGALLWARYIIERADVFAEHTLELWYKYYETGDSKYMFEFLNEFPENEK